MDRTVCWMDSSNVGGPDHFGSGIGHVRIKNNVVAVGATGAGARVFPEVDEALNFGVGEQPVRIIVIVCIACVLFL